MMKINVKKARVHVTAHFHAEGSVLGQSIEGGCEGFETRLEVESDEPPERLAGLIRNAENGCYVMQTIRHPVPVQTEVLVNGKTFDLTAYPPPKRRA
jgi:organic hydroperoxide reductase OsmC/OhrA